MMNKKPRENSWTRLVKGEHNAIIKDNQIYQALDLESVFGELFDINLRDLYVFERYDPGIGPDDEYPPQMNYTHPIEFNNNSFVGLGPNARRILIPDAEDSTGQPVSSSHYLDKAHIEIARFLKSSKLSKSGSESFGIIQGGIGCGKTTLIRYFVSELFPELNNGQVSPSEFPVIVNFLDWSSEGILDEYKHIENEQKANQISKATGNHLISESIFKFVMHSFRVHHPSLFDREATIKVASPNFGDDANLKDILILLEGDSTKSEIIKNNINSFLNDHRLYFERILEYLASENKRLILFLDNVDHHELIIQKKLLELFFPLCARFPKSIAVVIMVREYTLSEHRQFAETKMLRAMHVTSPKLGDVLKRRLASAIERIRIGGQLPMIHTQQFSYKIESYEEFLEKWRKTFDEDKNVTYLKCISNGNTRSALKVAQRAMRSGHLSVSRFVGEFIKASANDSKHGPSQWSCVTFDEMIRLSILGSREYYSSSLQDDSLPIINLFNCGLDPSEPKNRNKVPALIRCRILDYLRRSDSGRRKEDVLFHAEHLGLSSAEAIDQLQAFNDAFLIESYEGSDMRKASAIYLTRKGFFFSKRLIKYIIYIENVIGDTFINYEESLHKRTNSLQKDIPRVLKFIEFLLGEEKREMKIVSRRGEAAKLSLIELTGPHPLSWKLLKSVVRRVWEISNWGDHYQDRIKAMELRDGIISAVGNGEIGGRIENSDINERFPEWWFFDKTKPSLRR